MGQYRFFLNLPNMTEIKGRLPQSLKNGLVCLFLHRRNKHQKHVQFANIFTLYADNEPNIDNQKETK